VSFLGECMVVAAVCFTHRQKTLLWQLVHQILIDELTN
jgi:hypothetical protein